MALKKQVTLSIHAHESQLQIPECSLETLSPGDAVLTRDQVVAPNPDPAGWHWEQRGEWRVTILVRGQAAQSEGME